MLRPEDHDRLVAAYERDRALDTPAAPVRDGLNKLAKATEAYAAALAALPPAARVLVGDHVQDVDAEVAKVRDLSTRAGVVAADLTARMAGGGRRTVLRVMGHLCARLRLLQAARRALAKYMPSPRPSEIVAAWKRCSTDCLRDATKTSEYRASAPRSEAQIEVHRPLCYHTRNQAPKDLTHMPSVTEIRTRHLLTAAQESAVTATTNLAVANPAADAAYSAIVAAVRAGGYDSWRISGGAVQVPDRLRGWSVGAGILPTSWSSIGLDTLVTAYSDAKTLQTRRDHEAEGLAYVISSANGMLAHGIDKESATALEDFNILTTLLSDIQTSMAE